MDLVATWEISKGRLRLNVALAYEVIEVDSTYLGVEGIHPVSALLREETSIEIVIRQVAIIINVHVQLIIDQAIPVGHLELHRLSIHTVIRDRISHQEALELGNVTCGFRVDIIIDLFS